MMKLRLFYVVAALIALMSVSSITIATSLIVVKAYAQGGLKKCGAPSTFWHDCFGKYRHADGVYEGEWWKNARHGQGTHIWSDGTKYVGQWKGDELHGQGIYLWPDGRKYLGEFLNSEFNGLGTYTWSDGQRYIGEFKDDKFNGQGIQYAANGIVLEQGVYENDELVEAVPVQQQQAAKVEPHTNNTITANNNKLKRCPQSTSVEWHNCFGKFTGDDDFVYEGEWHDNKRSGQGTATFPDGAKYVGKWLNDKRVGLGVFSWSDGTKYIGEFRDDEFHGQGTYIWPNKSRYVGEFKDDKFHGNGVHYAANGTVLERGVYENDKLVEADPVQQQQAAKVEAQPNDTVAAYNGNQNKIALVIGNASYRYSANLRNPRNDAKAISGMLTGMGFKVVSGTDLSRQEMELKIREFNREANQADISLLYYSGHGLQVAGQNYLIPVDAALTEASAVDFELINVASISNYMGGRNKVGIILLDACRNNPFTRSFASKLGTRSTQVGRGLAPIESRGGGLLVGFATAPGDLAADGRGANSPFTTALLKHLPTRGLEIELAMKRVKAAVVKMTDNDQRPWHNSDLAVEVYLAKK